MYKHIKCRNIYVNIFYHKSLGVYEFLICSGSFIQFHSRAVVNIQRGIILNVLHNNYT